MKHYRIFSFILLFICAAFGQSCSISSSGREVLDMNTDWAFYRGDVVEGSRTDLDDRMDTCRTTPYHATGNETLRRELHL